MDACHLLDLNNLDSENISRAQGKNIYNLVRPFQISCYTPKIQYDLANCTSNLNLTLLLQQILFFPSGKKCQCHVKYTSFTCGDFWFLSERNQTALKCYLHYCEVCYQEHWERLKTAISRQAAYCSYLRRKNMVPYLLDACSVFILVKDSPAGLNTAAILPPIMNIQKLQSLRTQVAKIVR